MFPANPVECLKTSSRTARLRFIMERHQSEADLNEIASLLQDRENINDYVVISMWANKKWAWASVKDVDPNAKAILAEFDKVIPQLLKQVQEQ